MMFPNRMRYFNKRITNRITRGFANSSRGPFAVMYHVGRRSGKPYETMIMLEPLGEDFIIALTYGPKVDWYRNLLAAGQGKVLWHGKTYTIGKPEPIDRSTVLPHFPPFPQRLILRLLDVQHFVRVKSVAPELVKA
jgi:deazaflavin-dependent oxidoreductase (nitroreductase family)